MRTEGQLKLMGEKRGAPPAEVIDAVAVTIAPLTDDDAEDLEWEEQLETDLLTALELLARVSTFVERAFDSSMVRTLSPDSRAEIVSLDYDITEFLNNQAPSESVE